MASDQGVGLTRTPSIASPLRSVSGKAAARLLSHQGSVSLKRGRRRLVHRSLSLASEAIEMCHVSSVNEPFPSVAPARDFRFES